MKWAWALSVLLAVGLAAGCSKGGFSERASTGKANVLRYPIFDNPTTLDPARVQDGDTIDLLQLVYEGLTTWGEDNKVQPNLAESWTVEDGGKTYVFKLRPGVKFHNGEPLTAADVKYSIERACDPALKSPVVSNYLNDIVGAEAVYAADVADPNRPKTIAGIEVVDDLTLKIRIDKPRPYFLGKLTYPASFVVSRKVAKMGEEITSVEGMVGTGPFKVASYSPQQSVMLDANPDYHGGAPKLQAIERPVVKDAATRLNKFKNGELDLVPVARQDLAGIEADPALKAQLKLFDRASLYYVGLNQKAYPPFQNREVRRAFAMAIDKDKLVNDLLGGVNKVANAILPPGVPGFREDTAAIAFDPAAAKKALADAGYPGGKGLPALTIYHRDGQPDVRIVAEAVAAQVQQNLGVPCAVKMLEWKTYLDRHSKDELPFFHMRWGADFLDAQNFLSLLLASYGTENHVGYRNPKYDALCLQADTSLDETLRARLYAEAEDMVLQDAPFVPIYFQRDAELISSRVLGIRDSLFGHLPHTKAETR